MDIRIIQSYLGNKSIQHIYRYTELASTRFKSLLSRRGGSLQNQGCVTVRRKRDASGGTGYLFSYWV